MLPRERCFGPLIRGLDRIPRQRRADRSAPIDVLGLGDYTDGFRIHARARSPFGRDRVRLEAEVEPLGTPFGGVPTLTTPYTDTGAPGPDGSFVDLDILKAPLGYAPHHWRVRMRGTFPFPWQSHPLRVTKDAVASPLHVSFEDGPAPGEMFNLYAGTILTTGLVAYDHVPVASKVVESPTAPGVAELLAPWDAGTSHYYLVSASNCAGESPRGLRSDGVERPVLPTNCGGLP